MKFCKIYWRTKPLSRYEKIDNAAHFISILFLFVLFFMLIIIIHFQNKNNQTIQPNLTTEKSNTYNTEFTETTNNKCFTDDLPITVTNDIPSFQFTLSKQTFITEKQIEEIQIRYISSDKEGDLLFNKLGSFGVSLKPIILEIQGDLGQNEHKKKVLIRRIKEQQFNSKIASFKGVILDVKLLFYYIIYLGNIQLKISENTLSPEQINVLNIILKEYIFLPFYNKFHYQSNIKSSTDCLFNHELRQFEIKLKENTKENIENIKWRKVVNILNGITFYTLQRIDTKHTIKKNKEEYEYFTVKDFKLLKYNIIYYCFVLINKMFNINKNGDLNNSELLSDEILQKMVKDDLKSNEIKEKRNELIEISKGVVDYLFRKQEKYEINVILHFLRKLITVTLEIDLLV